MYSLFSSYILSVVSLSFLSSSSCSSFSYVFPPIPPLPPLPPFPQQVPFPAAPSPRGGGPRPGLALGSDRPSRARPRNSFPFRPGRRAPLSTRRSPSFRAQTPDGGSTLTHPHPIPPHPSPAFAPRNLPRPCPLSLSRRRTRGPPIPPEVTLPITGGGDQAYGEEVGVAKGGSWAAVSGQMRL